MQRSSRGLFALAVICLFAPLTHARPDPDDVSKGGTTLRVPEHRTKEAYVTLLYAEEFLLGVRVLGQSLRESGTKNDLVALISKGVTDKGAELLQVRCCYISDMAAVSALVAGSPLFISAFRLPSVGL